MSIDKTYVLEMRKIERADKYPDYYKYCTLSAGMSDISSLVYRTSKPGEIGEIHLGEDGCYKVHLIAGDTEIPAHYNVVLDTDASWLWIYDDDGKSLDLSNDAGFEIYRAGEMGLLIRFK